MKYQIAKSKCQISNKKSIGYRKFESGFSLIEIVVTIGIIITFLSFITFSLVSNQRRVGLATTVETLVSDFRSQQIKAMTGETEGRTDPDNYGIYFSSSSYTLFHGNAYNQNDTTNLVIQLDPNYVFTPAGRTVLFSRTSGSVNAYQATQNTIAIQDTTIGTTQTITFNQYGVPVSLSK